MIVWLASYPRSGNTFCRIVLNRLFGLRTCSIHGDQAVIGRDEDTARLVGHEPLPPDFDLDQARQEERLWIIKTHDYPPREEDPAIYLIRDGREATLSYHRHLNTFGRRAHTLMEVIRGRAPAGVWGEHVRAWDPRRRPRTLLLRFEDLVARPMESAAPLADFLGLAPADAEIPDFAELHAVNPAFFRSGRTSSWRGEWDQETQLAFWMKNYFVMRDFGYTDAMPQALEDPQALPALLLARENSETLRALCSLEELRRHLDRLRADLDWKNRELGRKQERIQELQGLVARLRQEVSQARRQSRAVEAGLGQRIATLRDSLARSREREEDLARRLEEERQEHARVRGELHGIRASLCWRLTAWPAALAAWLRRR